MMIPMWQTCCASSCLKRNLCLDFAPDGVAGLQAIAAYRPDILLLDIIMPRLDGFGVIEKLRAEPGTRDLPIIVISAKELTASNPTAERSRRFHH